MPFYESVYIARPDISGAQAEALTESLSAIVAENGGKIEKTEYWGLKTLAYKIKKSRKGHYTLMNIDAPADAIKELERNMRISEDVLRYLTVRVDKLEEGPSAMMQSRGSRDDRGGRRFGRDRDRPPREPRSDAPAEQRSDAPAEAASEGGSK